MSGWSVFPDSVTPRTAHVWVVRFPDRVLHHKDSSGLRGPFSLTECYTMSGRVDPNSVTSKHNQDPRNHFSCR